MLSSAPLPLPGMPRSEPLPTAVHAVTAAATPRFDGPGHSHCRPPRRRHRRSHSSSCSSGAHRSCRTAHLARHTDGRTAVFIARWESIRTALRSVATTSSPNGSCWTNVCSSEGCGLCAPPQQFAAMRSALLYQLLYFPRGRAPPEKGTPSRRRRVRRLDGLLGAAFGRFRSRIGCPSRRQVSTDCPGSVDRSPFLAAFLR